MIFQRVASRTAGVCLHVAEKTVATTVSTSETTVIPPPPPPVNESTPTTTTQPPPPPPLDEPIGKRDWLYITLGILGLTVVGGPYYLLHLAQHDLEVRAILESDYPSVYALMADRIDVTSHLPSWARNEDRYPHGAVATVVVDSRECDVCMRCECCVCVCYVCVQSKPPQ